MTTTEESAGGTGPTTGTAPKGGGGFSGSDRFEIVRKLGAGAMGAVYEAVDRERDARVALKTLLHFGPLELYLFKNEFRSLANIVHPNLVGLYELLAEDDVWFFTMDFVAGVDLLEWVRDGEAPIPRERPSTTMNTIAADDGPLAGAAPPPSEVPTDAGGDAAPSSFSAIEDTLAVDVGAAPPAPGSFPVIEDTLALDLPAGGPPSDALVSAASGPGSTGGEERELGPAYPPLSQHGIDRLREAFAQLCDAVDALHRRGKLHRDIKPSNVMVDEAGKVVLLDFGLIVDLRDEGDGSPTTIAGTVQYMSPEQARGEALTAASDWYAVGCVLHEMLSGRPTFEGTTLEVVLSKSRGDALPPLPPEIEQDAPDLAALCGDLLAHDPEDRPDGNEILARLGVQAGDLAHETLTTAVQVMDAGGDLFGRDEHLRVLRQAYDDTTGGKTEAVFVHGRSGMGKSELIRRFLDEARDQGALVLTARCYEREWVPFKAVDPLIDALVEVLLERGDEVPVPNNVASLVRLFPVLERVPALAAARETEALVTEPTELRRRAVAGFADLLRKLAETDPVVLFVDDLQWSDFDSVYVFEELLGEPSPPPLLLLGAYRDEEAESSPLLRAFSDLVISAAQLPIRRVEVGPLTPSDARAMAAARLDAVDDELVDAIATESRGAPFFIDELVRYVTAVPEGSWRGVLQLDEVVRSRVASLPKVARELLEVAATAARPTPLPLLAAVREIPDAWKVATVLEGEHLLHSLGSAGRGDLRVECFHDRVREAVFASLSADEAKALHLGLADGFEAQDEPDADRMVVHLLAADERDRALPWLREAARTADQALAFERAAALYGQAVELESDREAQREMRTAQARALVNCGRGVEAAAAYQQAAALATNEDAWRLKQAAADQLLRAGRLEEGGELVQAVLQEAGMHIPKSELRIILRYLGARIRIAVRGLKFEERPASALTPQELGRLDVALSASQVLAMTDTLAGALVQSRTLLMALDAGEPFRIVRALGVEGSFKALAGMKGEAAAGEIMATATELADKIGTPHARAFTLMTTSSARFQVGDWKASGEAAREAARLLLESCHGMHYELGVCRAYELADLAWQGRLRAFVHFTEDWIDEATDRRDLNAWLLLRLGGPVQVGTLRDTPDLAAEQVLDVRGRWPDPRFGILDVYTQRSLADIALYRGDAGAAMEHATNLWKGLFGSQLKVVAILRAAALDVMARATLAAGGPPKKVASLAKKLDAYGPGWGAAPAALARARATGADGWRAALEACEAASMGMHAAAARWRLGEALQGDEGEEARAAAEAWMTEEGVVAPARLVEMLAPRGPAPLLEEPSAEG